MPDPQFETSEGEVIGGIRRWWAALSPNVRGGLMFILASIIFTAMITLIKLASTRLHVTEVLFFRQITMVAIAAPAIIAGWPTSVRSTRPRLQLVRVAFAFGAMFLGFSAFVHLTLAEVTVISFSKSFFMTLLAIIFLQEIVSWPRWVALAIGFLGVIIIVWPQGEQNFNIWQLAALASAICVAVVMIIIRVLSREDRPVTILTYQAVGVGILMMPPALYFWKSPTVEEWLLIVAVGIVSAAAQYTNILAIRAAEASSLAPLDYLRLVFAAIAGLWVFGEWPDERVWFGAVIIIAAALFVVHREQRAERRARREEAG